MDEKKSIVLVLTLIIAMLIMEQTNLIISYAYMNTGNEQVTKDILNYYYFPAPKFNTNSPSNVI